MKRKLFRMMAVMLATILCVTMFAACTKESKSDKEYWFSSYESKFVAYDEKTNNINEAGTYWNMTVKKDCTVTLSVSVDVDFAFSALYFYVNGEQIRSEVETDIYSLVYKDLKLKKGDNLKLHAFWVNSLKTDDKGFEIAVFCIDDGTGNYIVEGIK
ncbi:MAG: hypothetical protein GX910_01240 [Clostridiaceae bacterium]|nr:hypothetical protein [Clostridiaceae bacterium]